MNGLLWLPEKLRYPAKTAANEQVAIRFYLEILETFRKDGPGWQMRMNDALRNWLKAHVSSGLTP